MTDYTSEEFWKGAPEASTHYQPPRAKGCNPVFWMVKNGVPVEAWAVISGGELHHITNPRYEEDVFDKIIPRPAQPWSGDGPPPVGTVCEMTQIGWGDRGWERVTINYCSSEYAITTDGNGEQHWHIRNITFRPIKTAEQIAAREAAIDEMAGWAGATGLPIDRERKIMGRLYDARYRRMPAGEDQ